MKWRVLKTYVKDGKSLTLNIGTLEIVDRKMTFQITDEDVSRVFEQIRKDGGVSGPVAIRHTEDAECALVAGFHKIGSDLFIVNLSGVEGLEDTFLEEVKE